MFLKRLDTVGFKSFAERISVEFVPGVTAVVGPNGSGKSNFTDAIRWVLGEQSAKSLRGAKMEDIIFAGSDSRKPLNFAEVTLTLDNEDQALPLDYQEVSVTRRVYRSGESEFYINKQPCRLKDIVDLFLDSGLGKEAFSIIGQGKVEEILSSKAEERRTIFEEAAGVLKYKQRKKKAEYKLAETQENLNRVEDIIYEIEGQLEPLKEQAAVAKDYLEKKKELEQHEVSLFVAEIEKLNEQWENITKEIDEKKELAIHKQTEIQKEEAGIEQEKADLKALDESIDELQQLLLTLTQELEHLEGQKQLISERLKHFEENKDKLASEDQRLKEKVERIQKQMKQEEEKLDGYKKNLHSTRKKISQIKQEIEMASHNMEEEIEELKSEYIERLNEQAAKRNENQSIERQLHQIELKERRLTERFQELLKQREQVEEEKSSLEEQKEILANHIQAKQSELSESKRELLNRKEKLEQEEQKLYQGYQYMQKLRSRKETLEEMKEDFAGFFQGVKEVLKARDKKELAGIYGAVAEVVEIPDQYLVSMETALGSQAQHIIVEDEPAARKAIQWLKRTNQGRATFLPLKSIQPKSIPSQLVSRAQEHPGFVGIASDLVRFDKKYESAICSLIGNTVISKTLKDANELASILNRRYRIVTLEGDVVNPGGSMTGGARKRSNHSIFTREKELEQLNQKLHDYEGKITQFEQHIKSEKAMLKEKEQEIEKLLQSLDHLNKEHHQLDSSLREVELKSSNVNDHLTLYDQEKSQFNRDRKNLEKSKNENENRLQQLDEQAKALSEKIELLTNQQTSQKSNREKLQEALQNHQVMAAEQEGNVKHQKDKVDSLKEQLEDLHRQQRILHEEQKQLLAIKQDEVTTEQIQEQVYEKRKQKDQSERLIQTRKEERQKRHQNIADMERELKEKNRQYQSLSSDIQKQEVQANRLDVELENRLNYLREEYMLSYEKAKSDFGKAENIDQTKQKVKLIRKSIDELGTVNLGAIDEYKRIKERYEFLKEQQTDLIEAKNTLFAVIKEMDEEMVRRFEHTFFQIKEEFTQVFQQLFGGGRADLVLTDPDDLLDTGVEIKAQPPGKKLQHLGLLSGGERALTAIALLFAILRVRPVPFCVLDEVEAALDEANVNRFAQYLKRYSEKTQFIVITHRKGTMEEADVLYGVTMQESGVSRLVSVRLEETEKMMQA
ncbi:MAG: chromosome segregation protein SMC [Bacillaceae bacterium]|nr:chromosome segregation protein SMC [Bacillaceae bacterium]